MLETSAETDALQELLDRSLTTSTEHLRSIIDADHVLTAADLVALLTGMKILSVATVTARGEPRISALDGHFLHARWSFSTNATSAKAAHLRARPGASVAHVDGEELAVFSHGQAERMRESDADWDETLAHWTAHYGSSPLEWGAEVCVYRYLPHWMIAYAGNRSDLLASRGLLRSGDSPL